MPKSLIGLGANLNHRVTVLRTAIERLTALPGVTLCSVSQVYETQPIGGPGEQNAFLNAAVLIESHHDPASLLLLLKKLEASCGRTIGDRWGPRTVDLDLLLHDDVNTVSSELILPHPRMAFRRFALHPACDIASDMIHPITGQTLEQLLNHLDKTENHIEFRGGTEQERNVIMDLVSKKIAHHGIRLQKITRKHEGVPLKGNSATWLMDGQPIDFGAKKSNIASRAPLPKLVVLLEPRKLYEPQPEFLPQLELTHSIITKVTPVDDVTAAILAMANQPVPMKNLSLEGW